jgi:hypothetical protein
VSVTELSAGEERRIVFRFANGACHLRPQARLLCQHSATDASKAGRRLRARPRSIVGAVAARSDRLAGIHYKFHLHICDREVQNFMQHTSLAAP